jgi:hypothetical protein
MVNMNLDKQIKKNEIDLKNEKKIEVFEKNEKNENIENRRNIERAEKVEKSRYIHTS